MDPSDSAYDPLHRGADLADLSVPTTGRPLYELRLRVRHYEMDAVGHVNNAVYLNYLEQAAIEHAAALGFDTRRLAELGGLFVVRRHEVEYLSAAVAGDELVVTTWPERMAGARATRCYVVTNAATGRRVVTARTLWVWVDNRTLRPRLIPREIMESLALTSSPPAAAP